MKTEEIEISESIYNYQVELMIGNLIAYKFPQYTHMINTRYNGGSELHIDFIDVNAPYQQEVADYVKTTLQEFKHHQ